MTLLASERSLLIRNKFRSVLQLRIQNRRQSQINADSGLKSTSSPKKEQKDKSEALRLSDNVAGRHHQMPPSGVTAVTVQEKSESRASRQKKARRDLRGGIQDPPAPAEPKDKPHLENRAVSFPLPADVFEGDISSCSSSSSSSEQHVVPQPAASAFTSPSGLSDEQLLSDLSSVGPPLNHSPVRTHSGLALLPATEGIRPPTSVLLSESNSMATMSRPNGIFLISQTTPLLPKTARPPSPACSSSLTPAFNLNHLARSRKPRENKPKMKKLKYHQYIPPDQRGASGPGGGGAKPRSPPTQPLNPAGSQLLKQQQVCLQLQILQHQQQQQQQQFTVVPSREQNSSGALPLNPQPVPATTNHTPKDTNNASKLELLPANLVDLKVSELRQQLRKRGLPVSGTKPALLQRLRPFQLPPSRVTPVPLCQLGGGTEPLNPSHPLLAHHSPSSSCSSGDSPGSSPNQQMYIHDHGVPNGICGTTWRTELGVEFDMKERMKCRARDSSANAVNEEPGCTRGNRETDGETEVLFTQVFCSQPCPSDMIDRDFELPVEITASPGQNSPGIRSLEEELQEAIQKVQLYPRQSIDDILDEPIVSVDSVNGSIDNSLIPSSPPPPQVDQSQKSQQHSKDSNFLPLCSSLLLELPPSPAVISPSHITPAPAPPPICTSPPLQSTRKSRKRRAQAMFDAAEILETLTSGLRPITPPAPPFAETDFGLDSDLNINRVLDLMIEQW
ncbi:myocardin isoform X5 [Phyllopteryx taeniolatus]|uniref:myocardin isoform X5 n=1 Tax=Phyllopteryx taeniolatus TaxID=161469 RepID=UPI002AD453A4|nr:myocardin isoform X5 [Phyllopteryx taeniolatus]